MAIATLSDLASLLRVDASAVVGYQTHLDLAEGLVVGAFGAQATWPSAAKATVLAAVLRAYYNPQGLQSETVGGVTSVFADAGMGVYVTTAEQRRIAAALGSGATPRFEFPAPDYTWATSDATVVSG